MIWGVIGAFFGGFLVGFVFSGMFMKSPDEKKLEDEEQAEYMKKLAEKNKEKKKK